MKKSTVKIIRDLVASMQFKLTIKSVTDNGDGTYLLETGCTHYLHKGSNSLLTIDDVQVEIVEVVLNTSIKVKGSLVLPIANVQYLPAPYFFHGTIKQTNTELSEEQDMSKKTPMVYLLRPITETNDAQDLNDSPIEREVPVTLFFLTEADFLWRTDEFDHEAVDPMASMAYTFIDTLKLDTGIGKIDTYELGDKIKFANYNINGDDKILFKDNLSGKQMDITLPILAECCDCEDC